MSLDKYHWDEQAMYPPPLEIIWESGRILGNRGVIVCKCGHMSPPPPIHHGGSVEDGFTQRHSQLSDILHRP